MDETFDVAGLFLDDDNNENDKYNIIKFNVNLDELLSEGAVSDLYLQARKEYLDSIKPYETKSSFIKRLQLIEKNFPPHPLVPNYNYYLLKKIPLESRQLELFPTQQERLSNPGFVRVDKSFGSITLNKGSFHHSLWGHMIWNCSRYLSKRILLNDIPVRGRTVLELGAGLGLPSIVSAHCGARAVVVTDYPDKNLMDILELNAKSTIGFSSNLEFSEKKDNLFVKPLLWGNIDHINCCLEIVGSSGFDIVILSDVMFNHICHDDLLKTVAATLSRDRNAAAYLVCSHHVPRRMGLDLQLLEKCSKYGLIYAKIDQEDYPTLFPGKTEVPAVQTPVHCWKICHIIDDAGYPINPLEKYDVVVQGTGMTESFLSAALSMAGARILHLDSSSNYGSVFFTSDFFNFHDIFTSSETITTVDDGKDWSKREGFGLKDATNYIVHTNIISQYTLNHRQIHSIMLDALPLLHLSRGDMINSLVNVSESLEFMPVDRVLVINKKNDIKKFDEETSKYIFNKVPFTRADIFKSTTLFDNPLDKFHLTKFLKDIEKEFEHNAEDSGNEGEISKRINKKTSEFKFPWDDPKNRDMPVEIFLKKYYHLSDKQIEMLLLGHGLIPKWYGQTINSFSQYSLCSAINLIKEYLASIGRFNICQTPFIVSMYGSGEIPQCLCRTSAVWNSTIILRRWIQDVEYDNEKAFVKLSNDQVITTKCIVMADDLYSSLPIGNNRITSDSKNLKKNLQSLSLHRGILITKQPLIDWAQLVEYCNDKTEDEGQAKLRNRYSFPTALSILPPSSTGCKAPILIHQYSSATGHCLENLGICILHFTADTSLISRGSFEKIIDSFILKDEEKYEENNGKEVKVKSVGILASSVLYHSTFVLDSKAFAIMSGGGFLYRDLLKKPRFKLPGTFPDINPIFTVKTLFTNQNSIANHIYAYKNYLNKGKDTLPMISLLNDGIYSKESRNVYYSILDHLSTMKVNLRKREIKGIPDLLDKEQTFFPFLGKEQDASAANGNESDDESYLNQIKTLLTKIDV